MYYGRFEFRRLTATRTGARLGCRSGRCGSRRKTSRTEYFFFSASCQPFPAPLAAGQTMVLRLCCLATAWVAVHFDAHQNACHQHKKGGSYQHHGVHRVRLSWLVSATHDSLARSLRMLLQGSEVGEKSSKVLVQFCIDSVAFADVPGLEACKNLCD